MYIKVKNYPTFIFSVGTFLLGASLFDREFLSDIYLFILLCLFGGLFIGFLFKSFTPSIKENIIWSTISFSVGAFIGYMAYAS